MARHKVGPYSVEILHRQDKNDRVSVKVFVFLGREYVEQAEFAYNGFNTLELGRRLPSLANIPVRRLDAVIEDAREWPKEKDKKQARSAKTKGRQKTIRRTGKR